jgi:hypothetical protein
MIKVRPVALEDLIALVRGMPVVNRKGHLVAIEIDFE